MSFFKEWDFYFEAPETCKDPKYINQKYKNTKFYSKGCTSGKAVSTNRQWCSEKLGPWYNRCKYCSGSGWSYSIADNKCWRLKTGCTGNTYLYSPTSLCYDEDSACKPEMMTNKTEYGCSNNLNVRDYDLYQLSSNNCDCVAGDCTVYKVCTYDNSIFTVLGGVGSDKLVKSVKILYKNANDCDFNVNRVFKATIQFSKITKWEMLDTIKNLFDSIATTASIKSFIQYHNFIGYKMIEFYLAMNVENNVKVDLRTFSKYIPFFMVFNNSSASGLTQPYTYSSNNNTYDFTRDFFTRGTTSIKTGTCLLYGTNCPIIKTVSSSYLKIGGSIGPESDVKFSNKTFNYFLVKPFDACIQDDFRYVEGNPIIYLVYYNTGSFKDQALMTSMDEIKEKFINNGSLVAAPECKVWNEYVYYNHLLPNICYQVESESSRCNLIMNYNASPPSSVAQKCSTMTSKRFPDCKTYLLSDIDLKQPAANKTRTYENLYTLEQNFCSKEDTLECQCLNRETQSAYKSFQNSSYEFPANMKGNEGCWYAPCLDNSSSNIFIQPSFREEERNCPTTVCQNVVSVINRAGNVNISDLELRTSCTFLSSATPKPKASTTTAPSKAITTEESTITTEEPTEEPTTTEEEPNDFSEDIRTIDLNSYYIFIGIIIIVIICLVSGSVYYWMTPDAKNPDFLQTFVSLFFRYIAIIFILYAIVFLIYTLQMVIAIRSALESNEPIEQTD